MKTITAAAITKAVEALSAKANIILPNDTLACFAACAKREAKEAKNIFDLYQQNAAIAKRERLPICQDTGVAVVFVEIGNEVKISGDLQAAINKGISLGYKKNYLRASVVADPVFERKNTGDNTPAVIHINLTKGNKLKITLLPKGAGAENMSKLAMLTPAEGEEGVKDFVINTVRAAGANPCPPIVVGVGIGSTFEGCALLAKKALARKLGQKNKNKKYAKLEEELLRQINKLGIGPQGFGGVSTAMAVNIEYAPCHMASMPVAVNIGCHVHRHAEVVL
ncbi:fumarate hydratase subunit alpha [Elusimicrobium simillimum]|uniref:fumarate hydratase n=1 Tax=Elusimicrobium simillimum TaxID=3143438 RepID=UPI003C6F3978